MPHWRGVTNNCGIAIIAVWITVVWFLNGSKSVAKWNDNAFVVVYVNWLSLYKVFYSNFLLLSLFLFVYLFVRLFVRGISLHPANFNYKSLNPLGEGNVVVEWGFSSDKPRTISAPLFEYPTCHMALVLAFMHLYGIFNLQLFLPIHFYIKKKSGIETLDRYGQW